MMPYLALSLSLLAADPAEDCGCAESKVVMASDAVAQPPGTDDFVNAQVVGDCYCPRVLYSYYPGYNYWIVDKLSMNSGMEFDCYLTEEVLIYEKDLEVANCDAECSTESGCLNELPLKLPASKSLLQGAPGDRSDGDGATDPQVAFQDDDDTGDEDAACPGLPSLRLANKRPVNGNPFHFDFPKVPNKHIPATASSAHRVWVKVRNADNSLFTWLKVFDVPLKKPDMPPSGRLHRLGYEIESAPHGSPMHEIVPINALRPVTVGDGACKGTTIDGLYELTLPGGDKYNVRMHSYLPDENARTAVPQ